MATIGYDEIKQALSSGLTHLEDRSISLREVIYLCNLFKTFLRERVIKENEKKLNVQVQGYKTDPIKDIIIMGNNFIFKLRTFLTGEEIDYLLGGTYTDNQGTEWLVQKTISQNQIFQNHNLVINLQSGFIELSSSLQQFSSQDVMDNSTGRMWMQILNLSNWQVGPFSGNPVEVKQAKVQDFYMTLKRGLVKRFRPGRFYRKIDPDDNVAIRYKGAGSHIVGGYYLKDGKRYFFNRGWLFEWFQEYLGNQYDTRFLQASLNAGSIEPIIKKMDNFKATTGGDFYNQSGMAIQTKYGNQNVIKITTLLRLVERMYDNLMALQSTQGGDYSNKIIDTMAKEFANSENQQMLKNKIIESVQELFKNNFGNYSKP